MSYTKIEERAYEGISAELLHATSLQAIEAIEGKLEETNPNQIVAKFHKTILNKVLGDRTHLTVDIAENDGKGEIKATIYQLDAVGRPLMFGARKGVTGTVLKWFFAHLEHRLPKNETKAE